MAEEKTRFLRALFQSSAEAEAIFKYLASRKRNRGECLVSRTASQVGLSEDQVKDFFRKLQQGNFGKYLKSSRGGRARFVWGTTGGEYDLNYSLIAVGRVAAGSDEPLDGYFDSPNDEGEEEEDFSEEIDRYGGEDSSDLVTIRTTFLGTKIRVDLPSDFDPATDADEFKELIVLLFKNARKRT